MRPWRESPPAFVIDLSRLPSQGREIASRYAISSPAARPHCLLRGSGREKVSQIKAQLPDAVYCRTGTLRSALKRAIANPPKEPVKPTAMMDRYASKTVAQKLGIKESSTVALIDPPPNYAKVLGEMPAHVKFLEHSGQPAAVTLCFVREFIPYGAAFRKFERLPPRRNCGFCGRRRRQEPAEVSRNL